MAADEDGPIKVFVQLMYQLFGTNPVPVSRPEGTARFDGVGSLLDLYRIHSHELDLGFNDKRQETWPGLLGKAIKKYKDRVFEISTPSGVGRVKLRADRNSGGAMKRLELLPSADPPQESDRLEQ